MKHWITHNLFLCILSNIGVKGLLLGKKETFPWWWFFPKEILHRPFEHETKILLWNLIIGGGHFLTCLIPSDSLSLFRFKNFFFPKTAISNSVTISTNSNFCQSIPCRNGGNCINQQNGYSCSCGQGFYGNSCEYSN